VGSTLRSIQSQDDAIGPTRLVGVELPAKRLAVFSRPPARGTNEIGIRQASNARIVPADRRSRALEDSASAEEIPLDAHAFQNVGIDGNDFPPARVLGVGHLHGNVGVV
jgi:hypothetical protein